MDATPCVFRHKVYRNLFLTQKWGVEIGDCGVGYPVLVWAVTDNKAEAMKSYKYHHGKIGILNKIFGQALVYTRKIRLNFDGEECESQEKIKLNIKDFEKVEVSIIPVSDITSL